MQYTFCWVSALTHVEKRNILSLLNLIINRTNTLGFQTPLSVKLGMKMLSSINQEIKNKRMHLLLLKNGISQNVIGHLLLVQNKLPNCIHRAEISRVMIHPEWRDGFFLKEGFTLLVKKCQELKISSLELDVRAHTPLSRLWRRWGFEIIGENPDYVRIKGQSLSGFYMRQNVDKLKEKLLFFKA